MKKLIALLLALVMVLGLAACGAKTPAADTPATDAPVAEAPTAPADMPTDAPQEAPADEPTEAAPSFLVDTTILKESDDKMLNTYSAIAVNPDAPFVDADGNAVSNVYVNTAGADALIQWLLGLEAMTLANEFGLADYNQYLFYIVDDAPFYIGPIAPATEETKTIRLSTTTSVNDSGLLAYLLPIFEESYGYTVEVASAGTGKAIAAAKAGNADLILVNSKSQEEAFVADGFGRIAEGFTTERVSFLYNHFVLCGPSADPAGVADAASVLDAFASIADGQHPFISRGDGSGTHTKELALWPEELGIAKEPESFAAYTDWYISAGTGMGACLVMAEEMGAYILTDKATFLTFQANDGVI